MRKLATIRKIDEVKQHPNADRLELAMIDGWQCVVKKDEFKTGDLCVYFEIDSLIPISPKFEFLRSSSYIKKEWLEDSFPNGECFRLRTIKLRKEISQGLVIPLSDEVIDSYTLFLGTEEESIGEDVSEFFKVIKYDPPLKPCLRGKVSGNFPAYVPKTDQERCQNIPTQFKYHYDNETKFEVSIKLDGSSMTVALSPERQFEVCSRNFSLKLSDIDNAFVKTAMSLGIYNYIGNFKYNSIALQGELIGDGIQGNKEKIKGHEFHVFDVYLPLENRYATHEERILVVDMLQLKHVPILHRDVTLKELGLHSIEDVLQFAEGESLNAPEREGVVFKSMDGTFSFKAISNSWLLKNEGDDE